MTESEEQTIREALYASEPTKLQRLKAIEALERVKESNDRRKRIFITLKEALSQIRLDLKYLIFDLQATRQERDEYKFRLDSLDK